MNNKSSSAIYEITCRVWFTRAVPGGALDRRNVDRNVRSQGRDSEYRRLIHYSDQRTLVRGYPTLSRDHPAARDLAPGLKPWYYHGRPAHPFILDCSSTTNASNGPFPEAH